MHYCFQMFIFNFCLMPVPLNWARWEGGLRQRHWWLWEQPSFDNKNTPFIFLSQRTCTRRLSPVHLSHHRTQHRCQVPMTTPAQAPRPPGPRPAAPAPRPATPAGVVAATPARLRPCPAPSPTGPRTGATLQAGGRAG